MLRHGQKFNRVSESTGTVTGRCVFSGVPYTTAPVKERDLLKWSMGTLIQDAMPYLSADDREFIISGICPVAFAEITEPDDE